MPRVSRRLASATSEAPVLDGFGDMGGADVVAAGQIGDGPGDFQNAVPGAGRQIKLRRRLLQQLAAGFVRLAAGIDFLGAQAGVGLVLAKTVVGLEPARRGPGRSPTIRHRPCRPGRRRAAPGLR